MQILFKKKCDATSKLFPFLDGEGSDILQAVKIPVVSRKKCSAIYDEDPDDETDDIIDTQICAGIVNRDSCQVCFIF